MLNIPSDIEGKQAYYGDVREVFEKEGFHLSGGWEYEGGMFDSILHQKEGVTIYLRLPARAVQGKLDENDAYLQFGQPFLIKHVVHTGIVENDFNFSVLELTGLSQFQKPLDPDDRIEHEDKWRQAGEQALSRIRAYIH